MRQKTGGPGTLCTIFAVILKSNYWKTNKKLTKEKPRKVSRCTPSTFVMNKSNASKKTQKHEIKSS